MKKSRQLVLIFLGLLTLFVVSNYVIWNLWVEELRTTKYAGGDLTRMGYVYGSKLRRQAVDNLPKKRLEFADYSDQKVDVVTIGDSFSSPIGLGENCYYQDHLATLNNLVILNVPANESRWYSPAYSFVKLFNSGFFDKATPRYVILECVERSIVTRLGGDLDFSATADKEDYKNYQRPFRLNAEQPGKILEFRFISMANFKFLFNSVRYRFDGTELGGRVFHAKLRKDLFSVKNASTLLYLDDDIKNLKRSTPEAVIRVNENLNKFSAMLATKGIKLIFLPVVDKYNLYRDELVDDSLPRSTFFELFRELPKNYVFVDSKAILRQELEKGNQDIFFPDDSHWSGKAVEVIAPQIPLK